LAFNPTYFMILFNAILSIVPIFVPNALLNLLNDAVHAQESTRKNLKTKNMRCNISPFSMFSAPFLTNVLKKPSFDDREIKVCLILL